MYRENAAPPPPDPRESGRQGVKNCAMMQLGLAALHAVTFLLLCLQFSIYEPPPALGIAPEAFHEGRLYVALAGIAYVVLFGGWGTLNAWGLNRKSKVARWSSVAYAIATVMTCCAAPIGGFLLYLLFRKDVLAYFESPDA
jgi:hypothetical protein